MAHGTSGRKGRGQLQCWFVSRQFGQNRGGREGRFTKNGQLVTKNRNARNRNTALHRSAKAPAELKMRKSRFSPLFVPAHPPHHPPSPHPSMAFGGDFLVFFECFLTWVQSAREGFFSLRGGREGGYTNQHRDCPRPLI